MLRELDTSESVCTADFGGHCPYWTRLGGRVLVADTAEEIFGALPEEKRTVDPVAVAELLQFTYMLGNRTLIQGVQRMPWRATLYGDGTIQRRPPIPHGNRQIDPGTAARNLREKLAKELYDAARDRDRVIVLLTGGLDSRVVAGLLKELQSQLKAQIACVTWGEPQCRDVAYARRIASWYDWEFIHLPYDYELVWANIQRGAVWGGSEVAGLHLHAEDWFRNARRHDLVIAASWGDSVGRAEFSSRHLSVLRPALVQNREGLLHPALEAPCLAQAKRDRATAWEGAEDAPRWVRCELDMQENYMRRMIGHAMGYIRQFCDLHQAFTSEPVVSQMWSLSLDCRTDDVYHALLKDLDPRLCFLPWARTGVAPDGTIEHDSTLRTEYHHWPRWLRRDLRARLEPLVFSEALDALGLFYRPAVCRLWRKWSRLADDDRHFCQMIIQLASLELSNRQFWLRPCRRVSSSWRSSLTDWVRHHAGMPRRTLGKYGDYVLRTIKQYRERVKRLVGARRCRTAAGNPP
jgi:hypothetical protein